MGLRMVTASVDNWYTNTVFSKVVDHRLVTHIPSGTLQWRSPLFPRRYPGAYRLTTNPPPNNGHYVWKVATTTTNGATVLANGSSYPLLAVKSYGAGQFIYHGGIQPLIGHGVISPSMYGYLIYRRAIEWAFESATFPIIKLSPWRYPYDSALMVRHDFETYIDRINGIESSAQFESARGVKGDYYFCTGALR